MTTYVFGAGASLHAGYPLASKLLVELIQWARSHDRLEVRIHQLQQLCPALLDFEAVLNHLDSHEDDPITVGDDVFYGQNVRTDLTRAVREYFDEVRSQSTPNAYRDFAQRRAKPGDVVITFNYDVSLERELQKVDKWDIGQGYGFEIFPDRTSPVSVLKLHGSTNWSALLFEAKTAFDPDSDARGDRPVISPDELKFVGYSDLKDPKTVEGGPYDEQSTLILPATEKVFKWKFWKELWATAASALERSDQVAIQGYSLPEVDTAARDLIFKRTNKNAPVMICSKGHSEPRAKEFCEQGFTNVTTYPELSFEEWACL